jgi:hypothetical protein
VKGLVNILLECCRCICNSKGHDQGFKEAIACADCCVPDNCNSYPDKAIGNTDVRFGDAFGFG